MVTFLKIAAAAALLLPTAIHGQEIGVDICSCAPSTYEFTLDFDLFCPPVNITLGNAVSATTCLVSPLGNPDVENLVPVVVTSIVLQELKQDLSTLQPFATFIGPFADGHTFQYTSKAADPENIVNSNDVPKALQLNIEALNQFDEAIINVFLIFFTNSCEAYPVLVEGQSAGWTRFTELAPPTFELCPLAGPFQPSTAPSTSSVPSSSPSFSSVPSFGPSAMPSFSTQPSLSSAPSVSKSPSTSLSPSADPSKSPSVSAAPSQSPSTSASPSVGPSKSPSVSAAPSESPSTSVLPSSNPSDAPSVSVMPTAKPTPKPSFKPKQGKKGSWSDDYKYHSSGKKSKDDKYYHKDGHQHAAGAYQAAMYGPQEHSSSSVDENTLGKLTNRFFTDDPVMAPPPPPTQSKYVKYYDGYPRYKRYYGKGGSSGKKGW